MARMIETLGRGPDNCAMVAITAYSGRVAGIVMETKLVWDGR